MDTYRIKNIERNLIINQHKHDEIKLRTHISLHNLNVNGVQMISIVYTMSNWSMNHTNYKNGVYNKILEVYKSISLPLPHHWVEEVVPVAHRPIWVP